MPSKSLTKGKMYYYKLDTLSFESINSFTQNGFYRNYKAFDIPKELSSFDFLLNEIVDELKVIVLSSFYSLFSSPFCYLREEIVHIGL